MREAGLPVAVVPGVTAALGCAASVGIPLTHRKLASAVTFVSGHSAEGSREATWPALAAQGHTLAIYMGATEAASVRDRLLGAGADPTTPVAIVENGTRPDERVSDRSSLRPDAARRLSFPRRRRPQPHHRRRGGRTGRCRATVFGKGVLMAKNLSGDLLGRFRQPPGRRHRRVPRRCRPVDDRGSSSPPWRATSGAGEILLERARAEAFDVIDPFLVAVTEDDDGRIEPFSLREKIRASGLTFDAIAADAVRYA